MSYKTNPMPIDIQRSRADIVKRWITDMSAPSVRVFLTDLDAADRAAGVVRVDTSDEALVERIAGALHNRWSRSNFGTDGDWSACSPTWKFYQRSNARAVLAALREES